MSFGARVLRIMIASPGDVDRERSAATEEIHDWNAIHSFAKQIVLLPVKWETNATPRYGEHPQALINKQILEDADLLVGIFGTRLGTPTPEYESGTVEGITRHAGAEKTVKLYFSDAPLPREYDREQYAALEKYRHQCKAKGLYFTFENTADFRNKFRRHLEIELNYAKYVAGETSSAPFRLLDQEKRSSSARPALPPARTIPLRPNMRASVEGGAGSQQLAVTCTHDVYLKDLDFLETPTDDRMINHPVATQKLNEWLKAEIMIPLQYECVSKLFNSYRHDRNSSNGAGPAILSLSFVFGRQNYGLRIPVWLMRRQDDDSDPIEITGSKEWIGI